MRLLSRLARERGAAVLIVTHDTRIQEVADRIISMEDGNVVSQDEEGAGGNLRVSHNAFSL
jgi:putative ABC transport system ATP-binding protein